MDLERRDAKRGPTVGIVGPGAVGTALGIAIGNAGWPVVAVAGRDTARLGRFCDLVHGARPMVDAAAVAHAAQLTILAVPDDAIAAVAASMWLGPGRALIHTSGALGAEVLVAAAEGVDPPRGARGGPAIGSFHPLVPFTADVEGSVRGLQGSTIAIEGDEVLLPMLSDLAVAIGGTPLQLAPGAKPVHHAAAVLASGGLVALLDAVVELGTAAGLSERQALEVYGRLTEQTLENARRIGVPAALTGPIVRGDTGTLSSHLAALRERAPGVVELYLAAARRELRIAEERGALATNEAARVGRVLAKDA